MKWINFAVVVLALVAPKAQPWQSAAAQDVRHDGPGRRVAMAHHTPYLIETIDAPPDGAEVRDMGKTTSSLEWGKRVGEPGTLGMIVSGSDGTHIERLVLIDEPTGPRVTMTTEPDVKTLWAFHVIRTEKNQREYRSERVAIWDIGNFYVTGKDGEKLWLTAGSEVIYFKMGSRSFIKAQPLVLSPKDPLNFRLTIQDGSEK